MKFIKKHMSTVIAMIVFILVLILIFTVKTVFFPDESSAIYGTRLEGRENVEISTSTKNKVKSSVKENTSSVDIRIAGRIVEILIKTNAETSLEEAKSLGDKSLEPFTEEEKKYYDFQILIENDKNTSQFPIIGYKHHTKEKITWTKDRVES